MAERPKRPLSGYMLWLNENRDKIKKDNPEFKVTDIAKRGGELWRNMKDKTEWEVKAAECKEKYAKAIQEFERNGGDTKAPAKANKRTKAAKKPAKKSKKAAKESDDEDESEDGSD